ncbi:MAG: DNA repair protein RadC [Chlorobi bacterium]|nr:DNA repair protein RadC [Chlorobiota bacterium]
MSKHIRNPELHNALQQLFARQAFGVKLGLDSTRELLSTVGAPQEGLPVLHVAGTNGKGSVCAMLASVLAEAGMKVGLYSSPHLVDFRERIRVNGVAISEDRLALYAKEMMSEIERIGCTFFEGTTVMGLRYFAEENVDIVVLETGMGGRLDATNVVKPMLSIITSIGLDHTRHLGETYEAIAMEKAGIIKASTPVLVGRIRPRLKPVFAERAAKVGSDITFIEDVSRALHRRTSLDETVGSFIVREQEIEHLSIDLPGKHQIENARLALTALQMLPEEYRPQAETLRKGFRSIRSNTGIRGRFDHVMTSPDLVLDVAHNKDGVKVLVGTLQSLLEGEGHVRFVYGSVQNKNVAEIAELLVPLASTLYAVCADSSRSLPSDEIAHWCSNAGINTIDAGSVSNGLKLALRKVKENEIIVVCGSFFVVGEAIDTLGSIDPANQSLNLALNSDVTGGYDRTPHMIEMHLREKGPEGLEVENKSEKEPRATVKEWHPNEQPRERLIKLGPPALSDAELLAILLRTGTPDKDVLQLSRELLQTFGDGLTGDLLIDIAGRDLKELQQIHGIGPTKAVTLAAAFELGNRVIARSFAARPVIEGPKDVARLFIPRMRALRKEQFHVIIQNTAGQVIRTELVSEGNLNSSIVTPREVYRTAVVESAASIIGLHNHPSGNPKPSSEDIAVTRQLIDAGRILNIPFNDHIIVAGEQYVSMVEEGYV